MDAVKLIPQAFFEFFARLVPGFTIFFLWLVLFDGADRWKEILSSFMAGHLDEKNAAGAAFTVAVALAYVLGQLAAPFGKGVQRIPDALAWARRAEKKADEPGKPKGQGGDYDWLRANRPDLGALAAKIRSEYTMFFSLSAVFGFAFVLSLLRGLPWPAPATTGLLCVACGLRGFSTAETCKKTSGKLKAAVLAALPEEKPAVAAADGPADVVRDCH